MVSLAFPQALLLLLYVTLLVYFSELFFFPPVAGEISESLHKGCSFGHEYSHPGMTVVLVGFLLSFFYNLLVSVSDVTSNR